MLSSTIEMITEGNNGLVSRDAPWCGSVACGVDLGLSEEAIEAERFGCLPSRRVESDDM